MEAAGYQFYNNADFTQSTGYNSLYQLTHFRSMAYRVLTYQLVTNMPDGVYTLRAWVESSGGQNVCQLYAADFGAAERTVSVPAAADWTPIQVTGIVVSNGQCEIELRSNANAGNSCSLDDMELVPAQVTSAVKNAPQNQRLAVALFPNPARENFTLEFSLTQQETVGISLFTLTGQPIRTLLASRLLSPGQHQVEGTNTDNLKSGVYFLRIMYNNQICAFKFLKL